jgi:hypothetical protein
VLFVHDNKSDRVAQSAERDASADNKMWPRLQQAIMRVQALTSTEARVDELRVAPSRGEHVRSDRHLCRLWHQPEHGTPCSNHAHGCLSSSPTLARARWAIYEHCRSCSILIADSMYDLTLNVGQADFGSNASQTCSPTIGVSALDATNLQLHSANISQPTCCW